MTKNNFDINEGTNYDFWYVPEVEITDTITARCRLVDGTGTGTLIGTMSGAQEGVRNVINLATQTLASGEYYFEMWQDYQGSSQRLLVPREGEQVTLTVSEAFGV